MIILAVMVQEAMEKSSFLTDVEVVVGDVSEAVMEKCQQILKVR